MNAELMTNVQFDVIKTKKRYLVIRQVSTH